MKQILFFDIEKATSIKDKRQICEFGYVITDEQFNVLERNNIIINPNLPHKDWDWGAVKKVLTRKIYEYERCKTFPYFYEKIKRIIYGVDYVIGHTLEEDAKAINNDCYVYDLPSIDYAFYDLKVIYRKFKNINKDVGLTNILNELEIEGDTKEHDAESDAYNTMLCVKEIAKRKQMSINELLEWSPKAKDKTENYIVESVQRRLERKIQLMETPNNSNDIKKHGTNKTRYLQFLDNVKPSGTGTQKLKDKKVSISLNYEEHHFRQMINLIQIITNEGGTLILKASLADCFVSYDAIQEDGTLRYDSKLNYVTKAIEEGAEITILKFNDFLQLLGITEEELDAMPLPSFDFLFEEGAIIKDKKTQKMIQRKKDIEKKNMSKKCNDSDSTIGDILKAKGINLQDIIK